MRKFVLFILLLILVRESELNAQCNFDQIVVPKIKFSGVAPSPWAINGQVNDWETIIGPGNGNNQFPYNPPNTSAFNFSRDPFNNNTFSELDSPEPATDIRFMAFTHDDYNVYFYLRKLANSNSPNSFYYFCDINADGFMNTGEPVFGGRFNSHNLAELSVYRFVPNLNEDYIPGKGNYMFTPRGRYVDGYTMKGSVQKIFGSQAIPAEYELGMHEVFSAAVTENGYGVEFAVPWKYFRNWVIQSAPLLPSHIFTYHVALQKGANPSYQPQLVDDNAGSCCKKLLYSGYPTFNITNTSIVPIVNGLTYRMQVTLQNPTNANVDFSLTDVSFYNIQLNANLPFSPDAFLVKVNGLSFEHTGGTFLQQPIEYSRGFDYYIITVNSFSSTTFIIDITLPVNRSVSSVAVKLNFADARLASFVLVECQEQTGGGGKGINPVGFDITTEEELQRSNPANGDDKSDEKGLNMLKVYPNPSNGSATVIIPKNAMDCELRIEDVSGKLVFQKNNNSGSAIRLQNLKPGFYIIRLISKETGKQYIEKLVVQ